MTATPPTLPPEEHDQWVALPQGRLFTRTWQPAAAADAAPILMLHDSLGCVALWRDFPALLAQATGRRVIAYDRWGFGRSDPRPDLPALGFVAEEARLVLPALCEQLGLDAYVALGHSVGGGMAVCAAAAQPTPCRALVTIAAQVFAEDRTLEGIRAAREQFKDPQQLERLAKYHGDKADWVVRAWTDTWLSPRFADWTLVPLLPQVRVPALAIHGEEDEYGTTRHATLIGQGCAGPVQVELLQGIGHVPQREDPQRVVGLIAAFLDRHDGAAP